MATPEETAAQIQVSREQYKSAIASASQPIQFSQSQITLSQSMSASAMGQQARAAQEAIRRQYLSKTKGEYEQFEKEASQYEQAYKDYQTQLAEAQRQQSESEAAQRKTFARATSPEGKQATAKSIQVALESGKLSQKDIEKYYGKDAKAETVFIAGKGTTTRIVQKPQEPSGPRVSISPTGYSDLVKKLTDAQSAADAAKSKELTARGVLLSGEKLSDKQMQTFEKKAQDAAKQRSVYESQVQSLQKDLFGHVYVTTEPFNITLGGQQVQVKPLKGQEVELYKAISGKGVNVISPNAFPSIESKFANMSTPNIFAIKQPDLGALGIGMSSFEQMLNINQTAPVKPQVQVYPAESGNFIDYSKREQVAAFTGGKIVPGLEYPGTLKGGSFGGGGSGITVNIPGARLLTPEETQQRLKDIGVTGQTYQMPDLPGLAKPPIQSTGGSTITGIGLPKASSVSALEKTIKDLAITGVIAGDYLTKGLGKSTQFAYNYPLITPIGFPLGLPKGPYPPPTPAPGSIRQVVETFIPAGREVIGEGIRGSLVSGVITADLLAKQLERAREPIGAGIRGSLISGVIATDLLAKQLERTREPIGAGIRGSLISGVIAADIASRSLQRGLQEIPKGIQGAILTGILTTDVLAKGIYNAPIIGVPSNPFFYSGPALSPKQVVEGVIIPGLSLAGKTAYRTPLPFVGLSPKQIVEISPTVSKIIGKGAEEFVESPTGKFVTKVIDETPIPGLRISPRQLREYYPLTVSVTKVLGEKAGEVIVPPVKNLLMSELAVANVLGKAAEKGVGYVGEGIRGSVVSGVIATNLLAQQLEKIREPVGAGIRGAIISGVLTSDIATRELGKGILGAAVTTAITAEKALPIITGRYSTLSEYTDDSGKILKYVSDKDEQNVKVYENGKLVNTISQKDYQAKSVIERQLVYMTKGYNPQEIETQENYAKLKEISAFSPTLTRQLAGTIKGVGKGVGWIGEKALEFGEGTIQYKFQPRLTQELFPGSGIKIFSPTLGGFKWSPMEPGTRMPPESFFGLERRGPSEYYTPLTEQQKKEREVGISTRATMGLETGLALFRPDIYAAVYGPDIVRTTFSQSPGESWNRYAPEITTIGLTYVAPLIRIPGFKQLRFGDLFKPAAGKISSIEGLKNIPEALRPGVSQYAANYFTRPELLPKTFLLGGPIGKAIGEAIEDYAPGAVVKVGRKIAGVTVPYVLPYLTAASTSLGREVMKSVSDYSKEQQNKIRAEGLMIPQIKTNKEKLDNDFALLYSDKINSGRITYEEAVKEFQGTDLYKEDAKSLAKSINDSETWLAGGKILGWQFVDWLTPENPVETLKLAGQYGLMFRVFPRAYQTIRNVVGGPLGAGKVASVGFDYYIGATQGARFLKSELPKEERIMAGGFSLLSTGVGLYETNKMIRGIIGLKDYGYTNQIQPSGEKQTGIKENKQFGFIDEKGHIHRLSAYGPRVTGKIYYFNDAGEKVIGIGKDKNSGKGILPGGGKDVITEADIKRLKYKSFEDYYNRALGPIEKQRYPSYKCWRDETKLNISNWTKQEFKDTWKLMSPTAQKYYKNFETWRKVAADNMHLESTLEAGRREIFEELGIKIPLKNLKEAQSYNGVRINDIVEYQIPQSQIKNIKPKSDITKFSWVKESDLPNYIGQRSSSWINPYGVQRKGVAGFIREAFLPGGGRFDLDSANILLKDVALKKIKIDISSGKYFADAQEKAELVNEAKTWISKTYGKQYVPTYTPNEAIEEFLLGKQGLHGGVNPHIGKFNKIIQYPNGRVGYTFKNPETGKFETWSTKGLLDQPIRKDVVVLGPGSRYRFDQQIIHSFISNIAKQPEKIVHGSSGGPLITSQLMTGSIQVPGKPQIQKGLFFHPPAYPGGPYYLGTSYLGIGKYEQGFSLIGANPTIYKGSIGGDVPTYSRKIIRGDELEYIFPGGERFRILQKDLAGVFGTGINVGYVERVKTQDIIDDTKAKLTAGQKISYQEPSNKVLTAIKRINAGEEVSVPLSIQAKAYEPYIKAGLPGIPIEHPYIEAVVNVIENAGKTFPILKPTHMVKETEIYKTVLPYGVFSLLSGEKEQPTFIPSRPSVVETPKSEVPLISPSITPSYTEPKPTVSSSTYKEDTSTYPILPSEPSFTPSGPSKIPTSPSLPSYGPSISVPYYGPSPGLLAILRKKKEEEEKKKKKAKIIPKGYEVEIRRRKKFQEAAPFAFKTKEEAISFGARKVVSEAAATFRIKPSAKPVRETVTAPFPVGKFFRAPKRPEGPDTFIQIKTKRIITPGEKKDISLKGVAVRTGKIPKSSQAFKPAKSPTNYIKSKGGNKKNKMFF